MRLLARRLRDLSCIALAASTSALLLVGLAGCAAPPVSQSATPQLNVLETTTQRIPASVVAAVKADTGIAIKLTTVTPERVDAMVRHSAPGRFDVVTGIDLLSLERLGTRFVNYDSINGGKGSGDYAAAFGNSAAATSLTAICAQGSSSGAVRGLNLPALGTSKAEGMVAIADPHTDRIAWAWRTGVLDTAGPSVWHRIAKAQAPFAATSHSRRPLSVSPLKANTHVVPGTCVRWVQYTGILRTGTHINSAMKFVDDLLTPHEQQRLASANQLYPVTNGVPAPSGLPDLNKLSLLPLNDDDTAGIN